MKLEVKPRSLLRTLRMGEAYHTQMEVDYWTKDPAAGKAAVFERVRVVRPNGAAVVATRQTESDNQEVLMIRQYREAVDASMPIYEIPAGKVDPGEAPQEAAIRELGEETSLQASSVKLIKTLQVSPGWTDELIHIFHATHLSPTSLYSPDEDEEIELHWMELDQAIEATNDAKSLVALYWLKSQSL